MFRQIAILLFVVAMLVSCGTTKYPVSSTHTTQVGVNITSDPSGAQVYYNDRVIGQTPCVVQMPLTTTTVAHSKTQVSTEVKPWKLKFVKDGYTEEGIYNPEALATTNSLKQISCSFAQKAYMKDPTIMEGEADNMVSRDKPGQTALERTIIRWYFDSEPRGARIYWRVVSSIPHIVKNTNETYMTTTPLEETRAFNILGLSYENSRDVQIEIKASKSGYEDQVKRFNVRQAIDQQEISAFFDLVKKEQ